MATIRKRGDSWTAAVRLTGSQARYRTFATKEAASRWAQKIETGIKTGDIDSAEASVMTLAEAVGEFVRDALPQRKLRTQERFAWLLQQWCKPLGSLTLDRVTPRLIGQERDRLLQTLEPGTITRRLATLSSFFSWCAAPDRGLLRTNPVKGVTRPRQPKGRVRYLSEEERIRLFSICRDYAARPYLYPLVVTATYSGMRQGELLKLVWGDIDLENGFAIVRDSKNGEARKVPVRGPALEALKEWRQRDRFSIGRVFGVKFLDGVSWRKVLKLADISNFRFHDLRHTAASYLAMSGSKLLDIANILGHKSLSVTQRYAHLSDDHLGDVADRMAEKFK